MIRTIVIACLCLSPGLKAQNLIAPLELNDFKQVTSYDQLTEFVYQLDRQSDLIRTEVVGKSVEGRNLYALKFSEADFGSDHSKLRVLLFAQQHGNEQSGKEGALMLAQKLTEPEFRFLFDRLDLAIIPQVNPDGSEKNLRRNANNADLNRNHLILTEPETQALHRLFDQYLFQVTMDVHEYYPYDSSWMIYGYRKNSEITIGTLTNINVSAEIRDFERDQYLPFILNYLNERNFTSFEYCPGGPPEETYLRHSTFDINDGRQSFGIQNTFSFIQEGMNGRDAYIENLKNRAQCQMTGMMGLLEFVYQHSKSIKKMVTAKRKKLTGNKPEEAVAIQMEHCADGEKLSLPVFSVLSQADSVIEVGNYHSVVRSLYNVGKPSGYLIPARLKEFTAWVERQGLICRESVTLENFKAEQYFVSGIDSIDFEGDIIVNPILEKREIENLIPSEEYWFIPVGQLKGNMVVQALEPKSMLGLVTYPDFLYLLKAGEEFPIFRVFEENTQN